jgi:SAM-dependent methyltransferase
MSTYVLGSEEREQQRLELQASLLDPITERALREAGLRPGMRVLDLGCGVGDVALLASRIVGQQGEVVAVDRDSAMVETARQRLAERGLAARVVEGDVVDLSLKETAFDAAIGRLVLLHLDDPVAAVRAAAAHVRPGGLLAFQDFTTADAHVHPPLPVTQRTVDLIIETLGRLGVDIHAGHNLRAIFLAADLPEPKLRLESLVAGGADEPVFDWIAGTAETLLPEMERLGLTRVGEIDPDRLARDMREEVGAARGVVISPPLVAAWARRA